VQLAVVTLFVVLVGGTARSVYRADSHQRPPVPQVGISTPAVPIDPTEAERCRVPDFAKAIGHEEKWKLHNNCR
jgi:hypothetical protein